MIIAVVQQQPVASVATATSRSSKVNVPLALDMWIEDDGLYSNGSNTPMTRAQMVNLVVGKYRGPGSVTIGDGHHDLDVTKGGRPGEPWAGKTSTTATFAEPGDYMLHVTVNDLSGPGGGTTGCWIGGPFSVRRKIGGVLKVCPGLSSEAIVAVML